MLAGRGRGVRRAALPADGSTRLSTVTYRLARRDQRLPLQVLPDQLHQLGRRGSYFPSLLEPRRRAERALVAVVEEAYLHGVSTRKVDELAQSTSGGFTRRTSWSG